MGTLVLIFRQTSFAGLVALCFLYPGLSNAQGKMAEGKGSGFELIMFEQAGCHYCQLWNENIGGIYDRTPEGQFAPLRRVDIHLDRKLANVKPVVYTPTFVLYRNNHEVGRVTGYMSDDFFWGLLEVLLKKNGYRPAGSKEKKM